MSEDVKLVKFGIPEYWDDMIGDMLTIRELNHFQFDTPKKWIDEYYRFE